MLLKIIAGLLMTIAFTPLVWGFILFILGKLRVNYPSCPFIDDLFDEIERFAWIGGLMGGAIISSAILPFIHIGGETESRFALPPTATIATVVTATATAFPIDFSDTEIPALENLSDAELLAYINEHQSPWLVWEESYNQLLVNGLPISTDQVAISLNSFPRPAGDNGRGIHWIPTTVQAVDVVDRFLPEVQAMQMRWVVILNGLNDWDQFGNDYLVGRLVSAGIEPVMRLESRVTPLDMQRVEAVVKHYLPLDVHYYQIYNEPNLIDEWGVDGERSPERYAKLWADAATVVLYAGGLPGLAAMSPGGNMSDYDYLARTLSYLVRTQRYDLLNRSWLSIHNYTGGAPSDFVNDPTGFGRYRRYAEICRSVLGTPLPMIGTEGGPVPADGAWQASVNDEQVGAWMAEAYRFMAQRREPYFFAYSPWLLANAAGGGTDTRWESATWFRADGSARVMVNAVKSF